MDTLTRAVWRRKPSGATGFLVFLFRLGFYVLSIFLALLVMGMRTSIIISAYAWFRRVDDIMDGDVKTYSGEALTAYLIKKEKVLLGKSQEMMWEDVLLTHVRMASKSYGFCAEVELRCLWRLMQTESSRQKTHVTASREDLLKHAREQDQAILGFCVKVVGGNFNRFLELSQILDGALTRTDWLDDLIGDLQKGICNVSSEAIKRHSIDLVQLRTCTSWNDLVSVQGFDSWYQEEVTTLSVTWQKIRTEMRSNFGGVFDSVILGKFFQRIMIKEFDDTFQRCAAKLTTKERTTSVCQ